MFNIYYEGRWLAFEVRFTARTEAHLSKHGEENPEIQPHFVEQILNLADPVLFYEAHREGRYVLEGYLACKPYRVVLELFEEGGKFVAYPVSAHRIKEKDYLRSVRQRKKVGAR